VRKDSSGEFCHQGFTRSPAAEGLSIGITGTNGARIDHYLLSPDFEKQLQVLKPGLVMIALGTNDAFTPDFSTEKTKEYLGMLLARIRMVLPEVAVLLIGPPDHCRKRGRFNPNTEKVNQLYAEMAENLEIGFWNQQAAMGGPGSIMAWRKKGLATPDLVHFFPGGYALQARLLGRSIYRQIEPFLRQRGKLEAAE
jgi:lysophospholipase L1-like esterase